MIAVWSKILNPKSLPIESSIFLIVSRLENRIAFNNSDRSIFSLNCHFLYDLSTIDNENYYYILVPK